MGFQKAIDFANGKLLDQKGLRSGSKSVHLDSIDSLTATVKGCKAGCLRVYLRATGPSGVSQRHDNRNGKFVSYVC